MGAVYIATDERFGSIVAIKETLFTDEKFRKAFEREARLLNSLKHPALPRVSDHFIEGNGQFIVMEYIEGEDLSEQIEHEGHAFAVGDVLNWAVQLLDALDYLHSQAMPVIHRDIKPQNLKLTPGGQVVLLDFGLAKGNTTNPESATAAKSVFGYSRNYASLEQIQGTGTDPRSDLYSLAATLYHLLAGNPPVDALTRAMNVLNAKPDPSIAMSGVRPEVPPGVSDVLERAMSLNADERPLSALEMRSMLNSAVEGETFAVAPTFVEERPKATLFTQKTQLHSELETEKQRSDVITEVLPSSDSRVTKLRSDDQIGNAMSGSRGDVPKRRGLAIAAALGGVVLLGGAAGAAYVFGPVPGVSNTPANTPVEERVATVDAVNENLNTAANTNTADSRVADSNAESPTPAKTESARSDTKPVAPKTSGSVKTESRVTVEPIPSFPDPTLADRPPNGDPRRARDPRTDPAIPPDVWRKMTPEQRRKLRRALELQRQQQDRPDPPEN